MTQLGLRFDILRLRSLILGFTGYGLEHCHTMAENLSQRKDLKSNKIWRNPSSLAVPSVIISLP